MPPKKNTTQKSKLLTEVELELMQIIWRLNGATVHEVMAALPKDRKLAYTSVSTMLRIMEQKKFLKAKGTEGRGHVYMPTLNKKEYELTSVNHLVQKVFGGAPETLIRRLVDNGSLSPEEIRNIRQILDERK